MDLTPEFYAAADPQVSPSGKELLFAAMRRRRGHWQIWRMAAAGGAARQLTRCAADCQRAAWLPDGHIVYTLSGGRAARLGSQLYRARADGAHPHPITFGPGNFRLEAVLRSGRLLVSAAAPLDRRAAAAPTRALYTLRPDGSTLRLFRWQYPAHAAPTSARELPDGTVIFVAQPSRPAAGPAAKMGKLAWFPPQAARAALLPGAKPGLDSVRLLDGRRWLLSGSAATSGCAIYIYDSAAKALVTRVYQAPRMACAQATPLEAQPAPWIYHSILHLQMASGRVVCLNAYRSTLAPGGSWRRGRLAQVRVLALRGGRRVTLGAAPVQPDGSFYLRLPADLPLSFELLDARGALVQAQRSWFWLRPGEDAGCQGCHENPALAPVNRWPLALKRQAGAIALGLGRTASNRAPMRPR